MSLTRPRDLQGAKQHNGKTGMVIKYDESVQKLSPNFSRVLSERFLVSTESAAGTLCRWPASGSP